LQGRVPNESHVWGGGVEDRIMGGESQGRIMGRITLQNHRAKSQVTIAGQNYKVESRKRVMGWEMQDRIAGAELQGSINVWHREAELRGRITA